MALRLDITYPDGDSASFTLTANETIVGRDPGVGITLPDSKVSRRHARIEKRGNAFWLEDLGSVNGVLLDGLPVSGQVLLSAGSVLELGDCRMTAALIDDDDDAAAAGRPTQEPRYASPVGAQQRQGTRFALKVIEGELLGQSFVLDLEETLIGRGLDANIALDATSISRRHAIARIRDVESISIEDLGSSNGTYVGELALEGSTVLKLGEQVRLGTLVLELTRAGDEAESPAADRPSEVSAAPRAGTTRPIELSVEAPEPRPTFQAREDEADRDRRPTELATATAPESEAQPAPEPERESAAEAEPEPQAEWEPTPKSESQPQPEPKPRPAQDSDPEQEPATGPKADLEPSPSLPSEIDLAPQPDRESESQADAERDAQAEVDDQAPAPVADVFDQRTAAAPTPLIELPDEASSSSSEQARDEPTPSPQPEPQVEPEESKDAAEPKKDIDERELSSSSTQPDAKLPPRTERPTAVEPLGAYEPPSLEAPPSPTPSPAKPRTPPAKAASWPDESPQAPSTEELNDARHISPSSERRADPAPKNTPAPAAPPPQASPPPEPTPKPAAAKPARIGPSPTHVAMQALGRLTQPLRTGLKRPRMWRAVVALLLLGALGVGVRSARMRWRTSHMPPLNEIAREASDRILGYGPLRDERQWRERREQEWTKADIALRDGDYEAAQAAIGRALKQDATYPATLALRAKIERAARAEASAIQAIAARSASRWSQALMAASDAVADLENDERPSARVRRRELARIVSESRQHLASFCSEEARVACGQERYENCVSQAACAIGYRQDDSQALACLNLAASVTDPHNLARPPAGQGKDDGVDVGPTPAIDAHAAAAQYPDAKIRLALLSYAAGSMPLALLRLRNIDDSQSRAVLVNLQGVERAQGEASRQEQAGNFSAALATLESALSIDARVIPRDVPSAPRAQITADMQRMYLSLGDAAFAKSAFEDALGLWQRGLGLNRDFLPLWQALDKLDAHAQSLLDEAAIAQRNRGKKDVCGLIEQALSMTPDDSAVHQEAEKAYGSCKRSKRAPAPKTPARD